MAVANSATGCSSSDHTVGVWYSETELSFRDHRFTVPLDYSQPGSREISIFAREVVTVGKEEQALPYLLYLEGGPGFESPIPTEVSKMEWMLKACKEHRLILLDQRGTGSSTPMRASSMLQDISSEELVDYLKHFRADNIVKDAEFIRARLIPDAGPWTVLGQSYGGFCAITYLSFAPEGLKQVLISGGIPPIGNGCTADAVYKACFEQVIHQNEMYYNKYPQDIDVVRELVTYLADSEEGGVRLASGGILTPRGLQTMGLNGLGSSVGYDVLHNTLENVWDPATDPGEKKKISAYFMNVFETWLMYETNPLYFLLHESIYCQGASSQWSAHRIRAEFEIEFDAIKAAKEGRVVLFTGEMIFPWMYDEVQALKHLKEAAHLLANTNDWPPLYNAAVLNENEVPVVAAVYYEDMFVNFNLAIETAPQIGRIRLWMTDEHMHSGLRDGGTQVFDYLMGMLNGEIKDDDEEENNGDDDIAELAISNMVLSRDFLEGLHEIFCPVTGESLSDHLPETFSHHGMASNATAPAVAGS